MQVRLWAENLLFSQFLCNDAAAFARKRHLEDFLDDPCVLIWNELVAVIRVTVILPCGQSSPSHENGRYIAKAVLMIRQFRLRKKS